MDIVTLALAKKFTRDTVVGLGAIKGANCIIKSIEKNNGRSTVTFEWTGTDGTKQTREMYVDDGTPIYVWQAGDTYKYGDLVIYTAQFYRCVTPNSDAEWNENHWNAIGTADGNYSIVDTAADLPIRFTAADRKIYYVGDEGRFYYWNGTAWVKQFGDITNEQIDAWFDA